jgi:hypothetical protein
MTVAGLLVGAPFLAASAADVTLPPISVGAGVRTDYSHVDPKSGDSIDDFNLDSVRLYVTGSVTDSIKLTFNTEYSGSSNNVQVMDAIARFEFSDQINIWAGRFLPPSDRANLYGPYYANQWGTYNDGVQDGYPSTAVGRDNGVAYWGQFGILKLSAGAFDIPATTGSSNVIYAARAMVDLWDPEAGYFLNGTYYGAKDLLAFGVAAQNSAGDKAYSGDFLLEKKLGGAGVLNVEAEYAKYDHFGGYAGDKSDGYYVLGSFLFPQVVGIGKFQPLVKYAHAKYEFDSVLPDNTQKTIDVELNYIIKDFNARVSLYYMDFQYDKQMSSIGLADRKVYGLGIQLQI